MKNPCKWGLLGIPDHQGVLNVGGRAGAAGGPAAFRRTLKKLRGTVPVIDGVSDAGDLAPMLKDIKKNHAMAAQGICTLQKELGLTIIVGGGHDHAFSHLKGVSQAYGSKVKLGCINIDAHLDIRSDQPEITSGSGFFLALQSGVLTSERFLEFGIQTHCNSPTLWEYAGKHKLKTVLFNEIKPGTAARQFERGLAALARRCSHIVISLDLDAVAAAHSCGVSAPQPAGFTPSEVFEMMRIAGRNPKVVSLGIFELNPEHDRDRMTETLAAQAGYYFLESKSL